MTRLKILLAFLILISVPAWCQERDSVVVHFATGDYFLNAGSRNCIDSLILSRGNDALKELVINGHCDSRGSDVFNNALSLKRAHSVQEYYLSKYKTGDAKIAVNGFGENLLLNKDKSAEERFLNRRVEIIAIYQAPQKKELVAEVIPEERTINSDSKSLTSIIKDSNTKAGSLIALPNLNFIEGRPDLLPGSKPVLEEIRDILLANPTLVVSLEGHICCTYELQDPSMAGHPSYRLSENRAKAIYLYLIKEGIDSSRLSYKGFASSRPIYPLPEKNEQQRIANRRVELRIIRK